MKTTNADSNISVLLSIALLTSQLKVPIAQKSGTKEITRPNQIKLTGPR